MRAEEEEVFSVLKPGSPPSILEELADTVTRRDEEIEELKRKIAEASKSRTVVQEAPPPAEEREEEKKAEEPVSPPQEVEERKEEEPSKEPILDLKPKKIIRGSRPAEKPWPAPVLVICIILAFLFVGAIYIFLYHLMISTWIFIVGSAATALPKNMTEESVFPIDPHAQAVRYGHDPKSTANMILYPIHPESNNKAIHSACQTPSNFTMATRRLVRDGASLNVQTERGLISLRDLRYSLQTYVVKNDYDFMCAQLLDVPLCYCMALVEQVSGQRKWWLDITGRLNVTCVSTGATVYTSEDDASCPSPRKPSKRFKTVCVEYADMNGVTWRRISTGVESVVMQKIFEVHRGINPCKSSLSRTLKIIEDEAKERGVLPDNGGDVIMAKEDADDDDQSESNE